MVSSLAEISELSLPETDIWLMKNGWLINQSLETKDCNKLGTDGLGKRHMHEHKESHPVWRHLYFLLLHDFSWRDMVTFKVLCQFGEQRNLPGFCKRFEWVVNYINMGHEKISEPLKSSQYEQYHKSSIPGTPAHVSGISFSSFSNSGREVVFMVFMPSVASQPILHGEIAFLGCWDFPLKTMTPVTGLLHLAVHLHLKLLTSVFSVLSDDFTHL